MRQEKLASHDRLISNAYYIMLRKHKCQIVVVLEVEQLLNKIVIEANDHFFLRCEEERLKGAPTKIIAKIGKTMEILSHALWKTLSGIIINIIILVLFSKTSQYNFPKTMSS